MNEFACFGLHVSHSDRSPRGVYPMWQSLQQWPLWLHFGYMCLPSLLHWGAVWQASEWVLVTWQMCLVCTWFTSTCNCVYTLHSYSLWRLLLLQRGYMWSRWNWQWVLSVSSRGPWRVLPCEWLWVLHVQLGSFQWLICSLILQRSLLSQPEWQQQLCHWSQCHSQCDVWVSLVRHFNFEKYIHVQYVLL